MATRTERVEIIVTERGSRTVKKNMEDIGRGAQKAESATKSLRQALGFIGAAALLGGLFRLNEALADTRNKLNVMSSSAGQARNTLRQVFEVANRNQVAFEDVASTLDDVNDSFEQFGLSLQQQITLTERFVQLGVAAGGSFEQSKSQISGLIKAFADGEVTGLEFARALKQVPEAADLLSEKLGFANRGAFKAALEDGKVAASDLVKTLLDADVGNKLAEIAAKVEPTLGRAFTVLRNKAAEFLNKLNEGTGVSRVFSNAILFVANNLETLLRAVGGLVVLLGVQLAGQALPAVIAGFRLLTSVVAKNPFVILAAAAAQLLVFSDQIKLTADGAATLFDLFAVGFEAIRSVVESVGQFLVDNFGGAIVSVQNAIDSISFADVLRAAGGFIGGLVGLFTGAGKAIVNIFSKLPAAFADIFTRAMNGAISIVEGGVNAIADAISSVTEFAGLGKVGRVSLGRFKNASEGAARDLASSTATVFTDEVAKGVNTGVAVVNGLLDSAEARAKKRLADTANQATGNSGGNNAIKDLQNAAGKAGGAGKEPATPNGPTFDELLKNLRQEVELLGLSNAERAIRSEQLRFEDQLNRSLTPAEAEQVKLLVQQAEALQQQNDILQEIQGPQEEFKNRTDALNTLLAQGRITIDQYNQKLRETKIALLETANDAASGFERGALKVDQQLNNLAELADKTVTDAFQNMEDALVGFFSTGKLDTKKFVDDILNDLTRLSVRSLTKDLFGEGGVSGSGLGGFLLNFFGFDAGSVSNAGQAIATPIAGAFSNQGGNVVLGMQNAFTNQGGSFLDRLLNIFSSGGGGGGGGGGGLFGGIGGFFDSIFGGGGPSAGESAFLSDVTANLGFADGGQFTVGGVPGRDKNLVPLRLSRGERVTVETVEDQKKNRGRGERPTQVIMNIQTPDADSFQRSQSQILTRSQGALSRAARRNG